MQRLHMLQLLGFDSGPFMHTAPRYRLSTKNTHCRRAAQHSTSGFQQNRMRCYQACCRLYADRASQTPDSWAECVQVRPSRRAASRAARCLALRCWTCRRPPTRRASRTTSTRSLPAQVRPPPHATSWANELKSPPRTPSRPSVLWFQCS